MPSPTAVDDNDPNERLRRIEARLEALETGAPLDNATLKGLLRVLGAVEVSGDPGEVRSGDFEANVSGWRLSPTQAEFNDLLLRGGIIGNDALSDPVSARGAGASVVNFPVTTSETVIGTASIPVPAGFSQAIVMCVVHCAAFNGNVDYDYLGVRAGIQGSGGGGTQAIAGGSGGWASASASAQRLISGLDGGSISVDVRAWSTSNPWVANASNAAHIDAVATFLR